MPRFFEGMADKLGIPLKAVHLPDEPHVRQVWERDAVLIRPDDHVAWRLRPHADGLDVSDVERVRSIAVGQRPLEHRDVGQVKVKDEAFTGTIGNVDQEKVDGMAEFQR
jgi:FAD-dependent monooxygenase